VRPTGKDREGRWWCGFIRRRRGGRCVRAGVRGGWWISFPRGHVVAPDTPAALPVRRARTSWRVGSYARRPAVWACPMPPLATRPALVLGRRGSLSRSPPGTVRPGTTGRRRLKSNTSEPANISLTREVNRIWDHWSVTRVGGRGWLPPGDAWCLGLGFCTGELRVGISCGYKRVWRRPCGLLWGVGVHLAGS
jgi:hypothetical protein